MAAWQAWIFIGAAVAAAVWVFRRKVQPPPIVVPSLTIWRQVLDRPRPRAWWERVRRAVSLVLTAVIAGALAMAIARPAPRVGGSAAGRLLIVLDSSWSMGARTAAGGTRWQRAIAEARALAESSGRDDVALATTADGLIEGPTLDTALVETALGRLSPSGGEGTAWPRIEGVASTHFFTDGAVARVLDPAVVIHSVFEPAQNVAITAFVARPATSANAGAEVYLEVSNFAPVGQRVHVTVTRETTLLLDRSVDIGAGGALREVLPLDANGGARLGARVSAPANALAVDDSAVAWLATADPVTVAVVSDEPDAFARLLRHDPSVTATFVRPADYKPVTADVIVFDRWLPPDPPAHPALYIEPPAAAWLGRAGVEETAPRWTASSSHAVLDGVDPFTLEIGHVRSYQAAAVTPIAVSEKGTPVVSILDSPQARAVILGFGPADSNLASAPAFPVLVGNALEWLAHPASGEPRTPGPMELSSSTARVTGPNGALVPVVRSGDRALVDLREPGLYLIDAGGSKRVVGVNVGRPDIANVMRTTLTNSDPARSGGFAGRPWWMFGVMAAFVLLILEWVTWQRRVTV